MKLYDFSIAPNAVKVRVYIAEKAIDVPLEPVNLFQREQQREAFLHKNPWSAVPVLELDDGRCFSESRVIMEYLEELHPEPSMIGKTPEERIAARELERRCDVGVFLPVVRYVHHTHPLFAPLWQQSPAVAEEAYGHFHGRLKLLDESIAGKRFLAGESPTMADCTLFAGLFFGVAFDVDLGVEKHRNISRWFALFRDRQAKQMDLPTLSSVPLPPWMQ